MPRVPVLICLALTFASPAPAGDAPLKIAKDTYVFPGQAEPGRQPDGNSVIFNAPQGLVVVDTGRHSGHTQRLLDFAVAKGRPITAVINTHWHLDHIGGNPRIRKAHPDVVIHASPALAGALEGFLADYRRYLEDAVPHAAGSEQRAQLTEELAILDQAEALVPDRLITASGAREIGGKQLVLHLETAAVTGGDTWIHDPSSGTVIAGDLVTLPAPFLDTACPARWRKALNDIAAVEFQQLVPGHGPMMDRDDVRIYRAAFGNLLDCAASKRESTQCIAGWLEDAGLLLAEKDHAYAEDLLDYYFTSHLRGAPEQQAERCRIE